MIRIVQLLNFCIVLTFLMLIGCSNGGESSDSDNDDPNNLQSWGAAYLIENSDSDYSVYPKVRTADDGSAIVTWLQHDGESTNIWARRFDNSSWGICEMIGINNGSHAEKPQIAVASDGAAIVLWEQSDGTRDRIWANRFDGSVWGTPELIDINDDSHSSDPQIAMAADGSAIAVWVQSDGSRDNIWANQFDGNVWGTAERIGRNDLGYSYLPQVATTTDGSAIAVWFQHDGLTFSIWANRFASGVWDTAGLIESSDIEPAGYPNIAIARDGSAIAVWQQWDGSRHKISANQFDGSVWGTAVRIENNNFDDAEFFGIYPYVAFAGDGSAIAIWNQSDGIRHNIWANRFDGSTWGTAELIENNDSGDAALPQITVAVDGAAIAVWHQTDGSRWNIWSNRFDGSTWGTSELIENSDSGDAAFPQIAFTIDGSAFSVWHQNDGSRLDIWSNRFE